MNATVLPVGDRLLRAVEKWLLPWFDRPKAERGTLLATAAVEREERKAESAKAKRTQNARIINEYRRTSRALDRAGDALIAEAQRAGDVR